MLRLIEMSDKSQINGVPSSRSFWLEEGNDTTKGTTNLRYQLNNRRKVFLEKGRFATHHKTSYSVMPPSKSNLGWGEKHRKINTVVWMRWHVSQVVWWSQWWVSCNPKSLFFLWCWVLSFVLTKQTTKEHSHWGTSAPKLTIVWKKK